MRTAKELLGSLLIVAFRDGIPAGGLHVVTSTGDLVTKADGTARRELAPGTYRFQIPELERDFEVTVVGDAETEVTLHLLGKSQLQVETDTPSVDPVETKANAAEAKDVVDLTIQVSDQKSRDPIADATIVIAGVDGSFTSDTRGLTKIRLPSGTYSLSAFHPKFRTRTLSDVHVDRETRMIQAALDAAGDELEDVIVLAPKIKGSVSALVEVRRQTSAVTDVLGSEQMARAGDGDAAASLRRVTGLTLVGGKFVYVRGLGERYSAVQMNAFSLPSPEPARRVVPMDLFPTAILESILVQKSYSPDLPAEFGGGVIQLQTRSLPEKFFFRASISTQVEGADNRLAYHGGSLDALGMDDGTRRLPDPIREALAAGKKLVKRQPGSNDGISEEELTRLGQSLPNYYNLTRTSEAALPGISLAAGNRFKVAGRPLGVSGSFLYGQNAERGERLNRGYNVGSQGRLTRDFEETSEFSEEETRLAGSLDLGVNLDKHNEIGYNTFLLRHTTNFAQNESRVSTATPTSTLESTTLEWTERQLWTHHFKGKHEMGASRPVLLQWRAGWSNAERESPDRREYAYEQTPDARQMRSDSGGNRRTYSELTDKTKEFAADLTVPLSATPDKLKMKFGLSRQERDRRSDIFRLFFTNDFSGSGPVDPTADPETRFARDNIGAGKFMLQNLTDAADSYAGEQAVDAQFAMLDYSPSNPWTAQIGVRHERSTQTVNTFTYYEPNRPFAQSRLVMDDFLPAYSLVWKPSAALRARLAYSETLARPDFREMSTVGFIDDETGYDVQGNAHLKGTVIRNVDHRWEYYFNTDEYASIGGFYKRFENPVEVMFVPGVNRIQTFDNARAADNFGVELESRVGLRHATRALRRWSVLGNLTLINSRIQLDERSRGIQTSDSRPLQGQSPYAVNLQLQYDRPLWGWSATVLYNTVGKRITEVGTNGIPDTYEFPFHQVDVVTSKTFAKTWTASLRAKNLLDPAVEAYQSDQLVRSYRRGRTLGVSLGAVF